MQKYLNSMLKQKLGAYLDGLENTQMSFGVRNASMSMTNVQVRGDALDKFMLPVDIKFGTIKQLNIKVPLLNIQSSPVTIELQGMDLILAPKSEKDWKFKDIFSEEYMKEQLIKVANKVIGEIAAEQEQGWRDKLKIKILDNFTMNIKDVHIRFEDISDGRELNQNQIGQTTFGILLSELDLKTVDANGNAIFHDRTLNGGNITKILKMEGFAVYLNAQDTLIIHQIAGETDEKEVKIRSMQTLMDKVVLPYKRQIYIERQNKVVAVQSEDAADGEEFLTYILRPMNLNLMYEHRMDGQEKSMKISIKLDSLQLSMQHQQLKAILKIFKTVQTYKKMAFMQEKLKKFRRFRTIEIGSGLILGNETFYGGKNLLLERTKSKKALKLWIFAVTSIVKSFQFKRGAIKAFKMRADLEKQAGKIFREQVTKLYQPGMDDKQREICFETMTPQQANDFWHVNSMLTADELIDWAKQVITPIEQAKYRKTAATQPGQAQMSIAQKAHDWLFGKKEEKVVAEELTDRRVSSQLLAAGQDDDDEFDEFFDCITENEENFQDAKEEMPEQEGLNPPNKTRDRTSFALLFKIKEMSLTLGKLSSSNKIEGIKIYNRDLSVVSTSPTLNIDKQFVMKTQIVEWGISLITLNRRTNIAEQCDSVIQTNMNVRREDDSQVLQWDMTLTKNDTATADNDIEFDLKLQIGQIVFKYNEDLLIRAQAIARLKFDSALQTEALDKLEELRENTQSAIHSLIYKRRNKYNISIGSPIFLLPINEKIEGKLWAIRTGALNIATANPLEATEEDTGNLMKDLSIDPRASTSQSRFNFSKVVRHLMRGTTMPRSRGKEINSYFDHFKISISQMGMTYFQSYKLYEEYARELAQLNSFNAKAAKYPMPPRYAQFTDKQQAVINMDHADVNPLSVQVQSLQKFDVLDEFEINIFAKLKKKTESVALETEREQQKFAKLPMVAMRIDTSAINVRLSHSIYNNLFNLKHIFTISKEKATEHDKELTQFNVQIKQQLMTDAKIQGFLQRKIFLDEINQQYETNYCILSGNHLYFYKEKESLLYIDYFYLKTTEFMVDPKGDLEVLLQRVSQQNELQNFRKSMYQVRKRQDIFTQEAFEAGTVRKLRFESLEVMEEWLEQIRKATNEMIFDWGDGAAGSGLGASGRMTTVIREKIAEQPTQQLTGSQRRLGVAFDKKSQQLPKAIQSNNQQKHGNFDAMVTSMMTEDNEMTSRSEETKKVDVNIVQFELDVSIPTFEVEFMKLKLIPGLNQVAKPSVFEKWVTYAMIGMSVWLEKRAYDDLIKAQINKLSLKDEKMYVNNRLASQIQNTTRKTVHSEDQEKLLGLIKHKLGSNEDFEEPAMIVEKKAQKKLSPRFEGIYSQTHMKMGNIHVNFMPSTFNNLMKLARATKRQTKPVVDDFMAGEEYEKVVQISENEADIKSNGDADDDKQSKSSSNLDYNLLYPPQSNIPAHETSVLNDSSLNTSAAHLNRRYSIDPEQQMVARATDLNENRNYDLDCVKEKEKPMLVICDIQRISIGMLHPKYQMELFRLHAESLQVRYEVFYDHQEMSCKLSRTTLSDLTGHPYSVNPKQFYKFVKRTPNLTQSPQKDILNNPREMFYFNSMGMKVHMIQSKNCPHKEPGFSSRLVMRIDRMCVNYIQEIMLRFNDYFMEQFMDCFFMSDPYKDPKKVFDEIRSRSQVSVSEISQTTDFKFNQEIGKLNVEIKGFEMKVKDRPGSKEYLLFEIPKINCDRRPGKINGLVHRKPKLELQSESIWTKCSNVNFWFGRESGDKNLAVQDSRLSLLKKPFNIDIEYKKLAGSEVIAKISPLEMDKAGRVNLTFTPIELIWPQSIYTYMLRCGDLNFGFTDGMTEEYYFIKWLEMSEHYMNTYKVVSKKFDIQIPALSMTLQNSDGSYIAEMIWKEFRQLQTNYTDSDKEINVSCHQFYILDMISTSQKTYTDSKLQKGKKKSLGKTLTPEDGNMRQAVVCPMSSPMVVNASDIINTVSSSNEKDSPKNLKIFTHMAPGGDKTNTVDIQGLKIFMKLQTFILLQAFFMNAFPNYNLESRDRPNGYNEDPERANTMRVSLNILDSLICLLNKPGQDSICCQANISIEMLQESIKRQKDKYRLEIENLQNNRRAASGENLFPEMIEYDREGSESLVDGLSGGGNSTNDSSDKQEQEDNAVAQINRIWFQKVAVKGFTPFICQLESLNGSQSFQSVKKRQMMNPLDIQYENEYKLKHLQEEQDDVRGRANSQGNNHLPINANLAKRGISVDDLAADDDDDDVQENRMIPRSAPMLSKSVLDYHKAEELKAPVIENISLRGQRNWIWGVTNASSMALIGITKLRISIQDVHLIFQIVACAGDSITQASVSKLKEIHDNIEQRENQQKFIRKTDLQVRTKQNKILGLDKDEKGRLVPSNFRSFSEVQLQKKKEKTANDNSQEFDKIQEVANSEEDDQTERINQNQKEFQNGQEMFEGLIEKLDSNFEKSMTAQLGRFRASTTVFQKIANGYTQKKYLERQSFFEFLEKDVLSSDTEKRAVDDDGFLSAKSEDVNDDDATGEENRRRTIMRINERKRQINGQGPLRESDVVMEQQSYLEEDNNLHQSMPDKEGIESDVRDDTRDRENIQNMFKSSRGPSSRKNQTSSKPSLSDKEGTNSGNLSDENLKSLAESEQKFASKNYARVKRESEEIRRSFLKESFQDAVSEFFYSCSGSQMMRKQSLRNQGRKSFHNGSQVDSDDEKLEGEIAEEEDDFESQQIRSVSQYFVRETTGQARVWRGQDGFKSQSFNTGKIRPKRFVNSPSINNSAIMGDNGSKTFFQENATMLAQSRRTNHRGTFKHCMDNVIQTKTKMFCSRLSFLFINDFNQAFTPVTEIELTGLEMTHNVDQADNGNLLEVDLRKMTANYFNLEIGEWEPLIENLGFSVKINQSLSKKVVILEFNGPVDLNITQACLRNLTFTYEAWMSMPDFIRPNKAAIGDEKLDNAQNDAQQSRTAMKIGIDTNSSYSINSDSLEEEKPGHRFQMTVHEQNKKFNQIEEESKYVEPTKAGQHYSGQDMDQERAYIEDGDVFEDNSQLESITPFQIKNQTTFKLIVIQDGIEDPKVGDLIATRVTQSNIRNSMTSAAGKTTQQGARKVFVIEQGRHCNYSVTQQQIFDKIQKRMQPMQRQQKMLAHLHQQQRLDENQTDQDFDILPTKEEIEASRNAQSEIGEIEDGETLTTFKNAVVIGIRINDQDVINSIDLNEISHYDPYVIHLSSSYSLQNPMCSELDNLNFGPIDEFLQTYPLDEDGQKKRGNEKQIKMKATQLLEKQSKDELGRFYGYIFYGVVLDKMQKQLIIRTPYIFNNKTLLTLEIIIRKQTKKSQQNTVHKSQQSQATMIDTTTDSDSQQQQQQRELAVEKVRFFLGPGEKFPLDQAFYDCVILLRVVDQVAMKATGQLKAQQGYSSIDSAWPISKNMRQDLKNNTASDSNRGRFFGRKFSKEVLIEKLIKLDLNNGSGEFVTGPESDSLCVCIKRQSGELYGTTDLVFLPPLSVKNALPCNIQIKRKKRHSDLAELLQQHKMQDQKEKTQYQIQKSQQKDLHTFVGSGEKSNEISLQIQVDGFLLSQEIVLNQRSFKDCNVHIQDQRGNSLTIGMRVKPFKAGYQITFFAHVVIQLETVLLLNNNKLRLYYEAESLQQQLRSRRKMLAGQDEIGTNRFVMCDKDSRICLSVSELALDNEQLQYSVTHPTSPSKDRSPSNMNIRLDHFGRSSQNEINQRKSSIVSEREQLLHQKALDHKKIDRKLPFFSNTLDIEVAGELTKVSDFAIQTRQQIAENKIQYRKYDFRMSSSLALADPEDFIYTKMVVVSPLYVLVNQMKGPIEVAQIYTEENPNFRQQLQVGDRKEWVWRDNTKESLISVRKIGQSDLGVTSYFSSSEDYSDDDSDEDDEKAIVRNFRRDSSTDEEVGFGYNGTHNKTGGHDISIENAEESVRLIDTSIRTDSAYLPAKQSYLMKRLRSKSRNSSKQNSSPVKSNRLMKTNTTQTRSRKFKRKRNESQWTQCDKVSRWEWSKGFSPNIEDQDPQMTLAIMIREQDTCEEMGDNSMLQELKQPQVKVIRVTKKLVNNTVFVIFEDESPHFPMYRIVNECKNVKVDIEQFDMNEPKRPERIGHGEAIVFGFYEPQNKRKVSLTLFIDKNDLTRNSLTRPANYIRGEEVKRTEILDLEKSANEKRDIQYQDVAGRDQKILIKLTNDGQTKTVRIMRDEDQDNFQDFLQTQLRTSSLEQENFLKQQDEVERKKLQNQEPEQVIKVKLQKLSISFVAKVQVQRTDEVLIEENRELALLTFKDIEFNSHYRPRNKRHVLDFKIGHFQIDNQSEMNPLFQQLYMAKTQGVGRNAARAAQDVEINTPFLKLDLDYRITHESEVTFIEKFHCALAESVLALDSGYLVNMAWALMKVRLLFENKMAHVHPLFMKDSVCDVRNQDIEVMNMDDLVSNDYSIDKKVGLAESRKKIYTPNKGNQLILGIYKEEEDLENPFRLSTYSNRFESEFQKDRKESEVSIDFIALQEARKEQQIKKQKILTVQGVREILTNVMGEILVEEKKCPYTVETVPIQWRLWHQQNVNNSKDTLYLKEFVIDQINMDLSFVVKTAETTTSANSKELVGPLRYLDYGGLSAVNLDEARFRLARLGLQNFFIGQEGLMKYASDFYSERIFKEIRKLLGSVGILGSPRSLLYSIGDGFHDFISMPREAFIEEGPLHQRFLGATYGMVAGTLSLTKQIGVGSLQTAQQFTRDFSQLILLASLDKDYIRSRSDRMILEKPGNFVEGFGYGCNSLVQSVKNTLISVVKRPWIEGRRRGLRGVGSGLYQSVSGLVFKPLSGALDLVSKSSEGCKNTIRSLNTNTNKERIRYPRTFYGQQQKIKIFSQDDALLVCEVLTQIGQGRFKDNHYLESKRIRPKDQNTHFLILTEEQLLLVESNQKELVWYIKTELIQEVKQVANGIIIELDEEYEGQDQFILQVDQVSSREIVLWLHAIALEFN